MHYVVISLIIGLLIVRASDKLDPTAFTSVAARIMGVLFWPFILLYIALLMKGK